MNVTSRKPLRRWGFALGGLAALLAAGLAVDTAAASRVEAIVSARASGDDRLRAGPNAYVGGFPFSQVALTGKVPRIEVSALDAEVDGVGVLNSRTEAFDVELPASRAFAGDFAGAPAVMLRRTVRLDGVAFGSLVGMTDLDIANPYDISPRGGVASEARLTGTVPGTDAPSTVVVTLRLAGPVFHMRPSLLVDAPAGAEDEILHAYTLDLDTRELPLGGPADLVQLSGGSVEFSRQRLNPTLEAGDLSPLPPQR